MICNNWKWINLRRKKVDRIQLGRRDAMQGNFIDLVQNVNCVKVKEDGFGKQRLKVDPTKIRLVVSDHQQRYY